ncbi:MAG TPA: carboxypeptidase-like regulatory domain-containing protein [Planctomycetota bacterium]|nr:carboxypeptidase-like regulatory domain-containing protein [Planctomycetota bacterium]
MRPLHSLFVIVALLVLAVGGWLLLRSNDPALRITAAGPAAADPGIDGDRASAQLREPESMVGTRRVESSLGPASKAPDRSDPAPSRAADTVALSGRVLDPAGRGVAGARVLLSEGSAGFLGRTTLDALGSSRFFGVREERTDADGHFRFADVAADALRLAVRASGFAPYDAVDVPRPSSGFLADIVLERGVVVAGRVVDAAGRGVGGVRVLRRDPDSGPIVFASRAAQVATTAGDGSFEVDVLAVGLWSLRFESEHHPDGTLGGRTERAGERVENLLVQLAEGATIRGRVTGRIPEGRDLRPLRVSAAPRRDEGAEEIETRVAEVSADGSFTVQGVRAGRRYVLRAVRGEGELDDFPVEFLPSLTAAVEAEAGESGVVLVLSPEAALTFQVVDAATGAPLEEFGVEAGIDWPRPLEDGQGRPLRHHPEGLVRVGDLRPRSSGERASLHIEAVGYLPYQADGLELMPGLDTDLGTIALEPAPLLTVRVVDDVSGAPIEGADVALARVEPPEPVRPGEMRRTIRASASIGGGGGFVGDLVDGETHRAETDADGIARLTAFEGSDVRLRVRAAAHAPWTSGVHRAPSGAQEREVRLTRGGTVVVNLFDAAGRPQAGSRVEARQVTDDGVQPEFRSPALTDEHGAARFQHLAAGRHRFRRASGESGGVFSSGGNTFALVVHGAESDGDEWVEVEVREGGLHDVEIHLPLALAVHGRLTEGGEPLADARLSLSAVRDTPDGMPEPRMFGGGPEAASDADGYWRFENVEPGEYTLRISHAERAMPSEVLLRMVDADLQRDVDLDVAVLEGRVLDGSGEPLAGVEVWAERARAGVAPRAMRVMAFAGAGGGSLMSLDGGDDAARARTDPEGRYELRGVQAGVELEVRGRGEGLQPGRSEPVRVAADERRTGIDLTLDVAGWIEVEGLYVDGSPAVNLLVTGRYEGARQGVEPQTILLDESGRGRLEGLAPGAWRLSARSIGPGSSDAAPAEIVVDVAAGSATPATLTAP